MERVEDGAIVVLVVVGGIEVRTRVVYIGVEMWNFWDPIERVAFICCFPSCFMEEILVHFSFYFMWKNVKKYIQ